MLGDFSGGGTGLTLFGQSFDYPILLAPTAHHRLAAPEAEIATVVGAGGARAGMVVSTESDLTLEEIAKPARTPLWFQLYIQHDRGFTAELVRRAEAAGYGALVVTVDSPVFSPRNREQRAGYKPPKLSEHANTRGLHTDYVAEAALGESLMFRGYLDVTARWADIAWLRSDDPAADIAQGHHGAGGCGVGDRPRRRRHRRLQPWRAGARHHAGEPRRAAGASCGRWRGACRC